MAELGCAVSGVAVLDDGPAWPRRRPSRARCPWPATSHRSASSGTEFRADAAPSERPSAMRSQRTFLYASSDQRWSRRSVRSLRAASWCGCQLCSTRTDKRDASFRTTPRNYAKKHKATHQSSRLVGTHDELGWRRVSERCGQPSGAEAALRGRMRLTGQRQHNRKPRQRARAGGLWRAPAHAAMAAVVQQPTPTAAAVRRLHTANRARMVASLERQPNRRSLAPSSVAVAGPAAPPKRSATVQPARKAPANLDSPLQRESKARASRVGAARSAQPHSSQRQTLTKRVR